MPKIDEVQLKKLVDEVIRLERKYYCENGDKDLIPALHIAERALEEVNQKAGSVAGHADFAIRSRCYLTKQQYYHIIDYLCGTNLESADQTLDRSRDE